MDISGPLFSQAESRSSAMLCQNVKKTTALADTLRLRARSGAVGAWV